MAVRLHPREKVVRQADLALRDAINNWDREHDLTVAEFVAIVNSVLSNQIATTMKYEIRQERHGNTDTPGGWA